MGNQIPPVAAVIIHEVENYDAWLSKFNAHQAQRKEAGIVGHHLNRGADNPNLVGVYLPASSSDKIKNFLANDELRAAMRDAGVKGTPSIKIMTPKTVDLDLSANHAGAIVAHPVADYDKFRVAYDAHAETRTKNGITGHAVSTLADDPNMVVVYLQADNVDTLKTFMAQDELKEAMKGGGVTAPPDVSFWNAEPGAEY